MIRINLLPYREQLRAERRKQFGVLAFFALLFGAAVVAGGYAINSTQIRVQSDRNTFLQTKISELDKQIVEIRSLREQREALLKRKQIIESLQGSRNEAVRLFNDLTRAIPDGMYLTSLKQVGNRVTLTGYSQSDPRVAPLMRNLESTSLFTNPKLVEVKAENINGRRLSRFTLDVYLVRVDPDSENGGKR